MKFLKDLVHGMFYLIILFVMVAVWNRFKTAEERGEKFNIAYEIGKTARDGADDMIDGWKDTTDIDYNYK